MGLVFRKYFTRCSNFETESYGQKGSDIKKTTSNETLFAPNFLCNHEMFNYNNILHHGSYLARDTERNIIIRSGSASIGCKERVRIGHPKGSKLANEKYRNNQFYCSYPSLCAKDKVIENLRKGCFSDIEFFPGIIFSERNKNDVQEILEFDSHIEAYLEKRMANKSLQYKKQLLVCYLFETVLALCIAPGENVSSSLGFESFFMKLIDGFTNEWINQCNNLGDENNLCNDVEMIDA